VRKLTAVYGHRAVAEVVLMGSHPSFLDKADSRDALAVIGRLLPGQDVATYYPALYVNAAQLPAGQTLAHVCQVLSVEFDRTQFRAYCPDRRASAQHKRAAAARKHNKRAPAPVVESTEFFELTGMFGDAMRWDAITGFASRPLSSLATHLFILSSLPPSPPPLAPVAAESTVGDVYSNTTVNVFRYQIVLWLSILLALAVIFAAYALAFMTFKKDTLLYSTFNPNWEDRKRK
jgi:hypothetical protein